MSKMSFDGLAGKISAFFDIKNIALPDFRFQVVFYRCIIWKFCIGLNGEHFTVVNSFWMLIGYVEMNTEFMWLGD